MTASGLRSKGRRAPSEISLSRKFVRSVISALAPSVGKRYAPVQGMGQRRSLEPENIPQLTLDVFMFLAEWTSLCPLLGSSLVLIPRRLKIMYR